jgi:fatty acid desaturase
VLALYLQYRNVFRNIVHFRDPHRAARAAKDILLLSSAGLFYFALVPALGLSLGLTVIPMLLALLPVFAWRALSDHYGVPPVERAAAPRAVVDVEPQDGDASARKRGISGWVIRTNPWLEWLWSSVNYHEVHHRYPWLSHIHLKQAYEATRESEPYLVVRGYWSSLLNIARGQYYQSPEQVRRFLVSSTPLP